MRRIVTIAELRKNASANLFDKDLAYTVDLEVAGHPCLNILPSGWKRCLSDFNHWWDALDEKNKS